MSGAKSPENPAEKNSEPLNFRVAPSFRKRFKQRALDADLKLNELLQEALAAWEAKHGYADSDEQQ